jgi:hypothetical protein
MVISCDVSNETQVVAETRSFLRVSSCVCWFPLVLAWMKEEPSEIKATMKSTKDPNCKDHDLTRTARKEGSFHRTTAQIHRQRSSNTEICLYETKGCEPRK